MRTSVYFCLLAGLLLVHGCDSAQKDAAAPDSAQSQQQTQADGDLAQPAETKQPVSNKDKSEAPAGKLPDGVRPTAYRLDLKLDPREDTFSGQVDITIQLDQPADHIWMHGNNINVTKATAITADKQQILARYKQVLDSGVVRIDFAEPLQAGTFVLQLQYNAPFDKNLAGLFKVVEQGNAYALAKSESIQARRFLPGFDEPGLKATYDLSLTIPAGYVAIANSPESGREDAGNGLEKVTFTTTTPMPTYLLSLSVGPFDVVERADIPANKYRKNPIPLRGIARKGRGKDLKYVLDVTPRMLEIYEQQLQRPYPFSKLDIVAAPQWPSGATELSAAITYREQRILVDGEQPAPGARLALLGVHAHEIGHMWFGNLVTPPWWDDLWLKEGFATWGTPLVLTQMEPNGGHELNAAVSAINAKKLDSLASTRAIREPIKDNNNIRNAYDAITYQKSLGVINMVDQYFGADTFRPALGRYIETFADGVANSPDFYKVIGEETNTPELTDTFRSFVEQKGVPLLTLTLNCDTKGKAKAHIKQQRYKPLGSPIADASQKWSIPICMRGSTGVTQCEFLTESAQDIEISGGACPTWVMPNVNGSGYYRFAMDEKLWQALLDQFSKLTPTEQLTVIDSAFAAFESGQLKPEMLGNVIQLSTKSDKRQVVEAPLGYLAKYSDHYVENGHKKSWHDFLVKLYGKKATQLKTATGPEDQLLYSKLLSFLAVEGKDPDARKQLRESAEKFTGFNQPQDPDALNSDLYESALTVAIQDSDKAFIEHLIQSLDELDDPLFENASANALGRITDHSNIDTVHNLALSDKLGARETFGLVQNALIEPELQSYNWDWLKGNFSTIVSKIPEQWRRNTPRFAANFCDQTSLKEVQTLFSQNKSLVPGFERALAQTEESIKLCMALKEQGQALVASVDKS